VEIRGRCHLCSQQFCTGRYLKRLLMSVEEFNALWRPRCCPQQSAERTTMHHAEAGMLEWLKCERINVGPPNGCFAGWHWSITGVAPGQRAGAC
jgi:hypothetical protein